MCVYLKRKGREGKGMEGKERKEIDSGMVRKETYVHISRSEEICDSSAGVNKELRKAKALVLCY